MRDRLINELRQYTNQDLDDKTLKELLIMYNLLFNSEYAKEQEDCLPQSSFDWR